MAQFAVKKLSFIGGSLRPVGAVVDVDDEILTPRAERKEDKSGRNDNVRAANSNLVPVKDGKVAIAIAPQAAIAPTGPNPTMPQQVPAGTVQTGAGYFHEGAKLVAEGSELAANIPEASETTMDAIEEEGTKSAFDHDGDGKEGGSKPKEPVSLSGKNKADLQQIATDEGVEWDEGMTNAELTDAITAKRG